MALVEREDILSLVAVGEHDDRRVCEADPKITVTLDDDEGRAEINRGELFESEGATLNLAQQTCARAMSHSCREQIVELCQHKRREQQRRLGCGETRLRLGMGALGGVERSEKPARVEQDQSPKPAASSSSTRSANVASPLSKSGRRSVG